MYYCNNFIYYIVENVTIDGIYGKIRATNEGPPISGHTIIVKALFAAFSGQSTDEPMRCT